MDNELLGALISAAASIVVAMISKTDNSKSIDACARSPRGTGSIQPWIATCTLLGLWFLASPGAIHPYFAFLDFLSIPLAVVALLWFRPIQPLIASSVTLGLFAINWIGWRIAHAGTAFRANNGHLLIFLLLACASATVVFVLSLWRCKAGNAQPILPTAPPGKLITGKSGSIAGELERLTRLYRAGVLSDDEFSRGKELILRCRRRDVAHRNAQLAS